MNLYERNATMQMIGRQAICDIVNNHDIFSKIVDILQAHDEQAREDGRTCDYIEPALDFFALGMIYGKREERQKCRKLREGQGAVKVRKKTRTAEARRNQWTKSRRKAGRQGPAGRNPGRTGSGSRTAESCRKALRDIDMMDLLQK